MAILLRTDKGSKLSYIEADENFSSLFYSASIDGNTLSLFYTGSQFAPSINPVTIDIPQGSSNWTVELDGSISRNSAVKILGNVRIIGAVSGSTLKLTSLPVGTTESRILVADTLGNVRYRTDLSLQGAQGIQGLTGTGAQGATGVQGLQGLLGLQGIQGFTGDQGLPGIQGLLGLQGTQGIQGIQGNQGTTGIQGSLGLQGIQGIQGNQGTTGIQGTQGVQGTTGIQGDLGTQGTQGVQGTQGIIGTQGTTGIQGDLGIQGTQGIQGIQGTQGIQGITGLKGDTGLGFTIAKVYISVAALEADTSPSDIFPGEFALIDTGNVQSEDNSKLYLWDGNEYVYINDLSGTAGIQGIQGNLGNQGMQGIQGPQGTTGIQGDFGIQGTQGIQGIQGIQGTIGIQGETGIQGSTGTQGTQGVQGTQGIQGTQGTQGLQGTTGIQGSEGTQGTQGIQGTQGVQGTTGIQGLQGVQGIQGPQGTQGIQGVQGTTGIQGSIGTQGTQGTQGVQGTQGIQGIKGETGGVSSIIAGNNITISPLEGTGSVTVNASTFPYTGSAQITGSLGITGSLNVSASISTNNAIVIQNGFLVLPYVSSSLNFSSDDEAAIGGVPLGGVYRNGEFLQIRIGGTSGGGGGYSPFYNDTVTILTGVSGYSSPYSFKVIDKTGANIAPQPTLGTVPTNLAVITSVSDNMEVAYGHTATSVRYLSTDFGVTWNTTGTGVSFQPIVSKNGMVLIEPASAGGSLRISRDKGATWQTIAIVTGTGTPAIRIACISLSADGSTILIQADTTNNSFTNYSFVALSDNTGQTFTDITTRMTSSSLGIAGYIQDVFVSGDGMIMGLMNSQTTDNWRSDDGGDTWTKMTSWPVRDWNENSRTSYNGQYIVATATGTIAVSDDYGTTFTVKTLQSDSYINASISNSGKNIVVNGSNYISISENYGNTFSIALLRSTYSLGVGHLVEL